MAAVAELKGPDCDNATKEKMLLTPIEVIAALMLIGVRAPVKNTYSWYSCIRQGGSFDLLL